MITNKINFPEPSGLKCTMMPFIQGDASSLPEIYKPYSQIINENFIEKGEIGFLTIHESFVEAGTSQRGYSLVGSKRNVHVEVGRNEKENYWGDGGGGSWGGRGKTLLSDDTKVLIANSVSDTCRVWNTKETAYTKDGDLSDYLYKYPEETGLMLKAGEVAKISILTPHECANQLISGYRQFLRIVGKGVTGRDEYFTINPLISFS